MGFIKNYSDLCINDKREVVLDLIEAGLSSIKPSNVLAKNFKVKENLLTIQNKKFNLNIYEKTLILGFGKGSAKICLLLEEALGMYLNGGFVIDAISEEFDKLEFTLGTHPNPSEINIEFSKKTINALQNLTAKTLVLVVICGGGSVLFDIPNISVEKLIKVNDELLRSKAEIHEINTIRKHLSKVKGGGLTKLLRPAKVVSLIFSDVPGNDLSHIASGPTVFDKTSIYDAIDVLHKYKLTETGLSESDFTETPKGEEYFKTNEEFLMLSNLTALEAMKKKAEKLKINCEIYSDKFQSDALLAGNALIEKTKSHSILLAGGETTLEINNLDGKGGRNQALVLASLYKLDDKTEIAAINSDGWDNSPVAGAIADSETLEKAKHLGLNPQEYLKEDDSFVFFKNVQDAIITDRLESNISDLIIVYRK
jgi:glycerate 2-kinase